MDTSKTQWVLANDQVDQYVKGHYNTLKDDEIALVKSFQEEGRIDLKWNTLFFSRGDSKIPEYAGILSAIVGSILTLLVTMALAFPLGVATAVYLEEFARDNRFTRFVEVNINNLAAIPPFCLVCWACRSLSTSSDYPEAHHLWAG